MIVIPVIWCWGCREIAMGPRRIEWCNWPWRWYLIWMPTISRITEWWRLQWCYRRIHAAWVLHNRMCLLTLNILQKKKVPLSS